jgi:hypothetical protein
MDLSPRHLVILFFLGLPMREFLVLMIFSKKFPFYLSIFFVLKNAGKQRAMSNE